MVRQATGEKRPMLKTTFQRARPRQRVLGLVFVGALLLPACDLSGSTAPVTPPVQVVTAAPTAMIAGPSAVTTPPPTLTAPPPQPTDTPAPPAAPTLLPATLVVVPPTTAAGNSLPVSEVTNYKNTLGAFTVIGTVRNQGTQPLTNIRVTATVSDNKGATIGTAQDTFLPLVITIPPGASAPFSITFEGFSGDPAKVDVASQADVADAANKFPAAAGLTVSDIQLNTQVENGSGTITGQVKNSGPSTAGSVRVLAVAYNAQGQVVDVAKGVTKPDKLTAGASAPYQASFRRPSVQITRVETLAVGIVQK